ncbi:DUF4126 domain-containing protein [Candidatus Gracilibacteria bacterium]|nr:DUF4126 domain-containing protein [Candidatus Gracilibacteria bacterium]NJP19080.1 DUF4126 domain-containing protein [Hydrococcus sp. CRU_1_1]NJQ98731.1 DUF4126 domain-containing protein [Hydrococcus sp. CSU_1_8]
MSDIINLDTFIELLLGIALSTAAGFRVFVPLLVLSAAAVVGHLDLPTNFDWIETQNALIVFGAACLLEIAGYYIPWFDHLLDLVATPAAFIAGTVLTASVSPQLNPIIQWTLAVVAGGGTAGLTKGFMNLLRVGSSATSGGLTNPILATIELAIAAALSILAITVPLIAGILVIVVLVFALLRIKKFFSSRSPQQINQS